MRAFLLAGLLIALGLFLQACDRSTPTRTASVVGVPEAVALGVVPVSPSVSVLDPLGP